MVAGADEAAERCIERLGHVGRESNAVRAFRMEKCCKCLTGMVDDTGRVKGRLMRPAARIARMFQCIQHSLAHAGQLLQGAVRQKLNGVADAAMMETADENAAMLQMTLESRFELMDDVGRKIAEDPKSAQDILTYLGEYANGYGFRRLCYMDATGWTISSDGKSGDFSFRTYFRRGMDGQYSITGEINDRLSQGDHVHVMSAPVRDPQTGEVIGVVLADYTPEAFQKMMDVESFGGEGRGYIVESTGDILVASSSAR